MRALFLLHCLLLPVLAQAHDTWFQRVASGPRGELLLGTGERYPAQQTGIAPAYLAEQGCRPDAARSGGETRMRPVAVAVQALRLSPAPGAQTCWAQLVPLEIELSPAKVAVYLREIRAPESVLAAWREQQRLGLPWHESYTKHARVDLGGAWAAPVPMDMDLVRQGDGSVQLLRDGQALAGLAVEFISGQAPFGLWQRSDAQGRVSVQALPAGDWLARAIDLRPVPDAPGRWESRFLTLAFQVKARPR